VLIDDVMVKIIKRFILINIIKKHKYLGIRHCLDFSDETGCPPRYPNGTYCLSDKYTCNNTVCVPRDYKCDGG
jgi:hypothetical protein